MHESTLIIAFDQHAASVVAAVLPAGHRTPALHPLASDLTSIGRFVDRLGPRGRVRCCYEAGPCGFELQRYVQGRGIPCDVIPLNRASEHTEALSSSQVIIDRSFHIRAVVDSVWPTKGTESTVNNEGTVSDASLLRCSSVSSVSFAAYTEAKAV